MFLTLYLLKIALFRGLECLRAYVRPDYRKRQGPAQLAAQLEHEYRQRIGLLPGGAAGAPDLQPPFGPVSVHVILLHDHLECIELRGVSEKARLIRRDEVEQGDQLLSCLLSSVLEIVMVFLEGRKAKLLESAGQPAFEEIYLVLREVDARLLVDKVSEQDKLLVSQHASSGRERFSSASVAAANTSSSMLFVKGTTYGIALLSLSPERALRLPILMRLFPSFSPPAKMEKREGSLKTARAARAWYLVHKGLKRVEKYLQQKLPETLQSLLTDHLEHLVRDIAALERRLEEVQISFVLNKVADHANGRLSHPLVGVSYQPFQKRKIGARVYDKG